jgi:dihydrofolate synthase/folylpolyglutamate synthase
LLDALRRWNCPLSLRGRDFDLSVTVSSWNWFGTDAGGQRVELRDLPLLDLPMQNAALALQAYLLMDLPWHATRPFVRLCCILASPAGWIVERSSGRASN